MAFPHKREKIAATIQSWIDQGRFAPGARFPSDQELARHFGVSHLTVRGALRPFVASGTLERRTGFGTVLRKGPSIGVAHALTNAVGGVIAGVSSSFFSEILRGIETELFLSGRPFLLGHHWEMPEREEVLIRRWREQGVSRLMLVPLAPCADFYRSLLDAGVRIVFVDRTIEGVDVPSVGSLDREGAAMVVRLLAKLGHRRILHLAGPADVSTAVQRRQGFLQACGDLGLDTTDAVATAGFSIEDGFRACKALLGRKAPLPDAVFAVNDMVAVGALKALAQHGIEVPRDLSVVGYADTDLGLNFQLTTVRQFPERMGAHAAKLIAADALSGAGQSLWLQPEIVLRATAVAR